MLYLGCHLSSAGGYDAMVTQAASIGANTFAFFTRNPRGGKAKAIDPGDAQTAVDHMKALSFGKVVAHAPYTMNLCSGDAGIRQFAFDMLKDDLQRMESTPHQLYNFHPGSHVGQGVEIGIGQITAALNAAMFPEMTTTVLLETMAGKGSEIGAQFSQLRQILDGTTLSSHMGVCLDTCHVYDGGYDIVADLDGVLTAFDKEVGLPYLKALHMNDSMNPFGSHKDRHQKIGQGSLGLEAMVRILTHPALQDLPVILETPNELDGYRAEIALLREACGQPLGCR